MLLLGETETVPGPLMGTKRELQNYWEGRLHDISHTDKTVQKVVIVHNTIPLLEKVLQGLQEHKIQYGGSMRPSG